MERNFNNRDFEQFVQQNADQYRMFPSEKVWNNIHNTLHTRRRWYGIGLSLLLLTTAVVTWVMLLGPSGQKQQIAGNTSSLVSKNSTESKNINVAPAIIVAKAPAANRTEEKNPEDKLHNNLFLSDVTVPLETSNEPIFATTEIQTEISPVVEITNAELKPEKIAVPRLASNTKTVYSQIQTTAAPVITAALYQTTTDNNFVAATDVKTEENPVADADIKSPLLQKEKDIYPMSIESVVNSYVRFTPKRKMSLQLYFLPTISYRKLIENKTFLLNSQQISNTSPLNYVVAHDINTVVTHKPDIGLELGFNAGFPIAKNIKLTTGLQFNVSKYDIKAYPYPIYEDARIALANTNGSASVSTIQSKYRNFEAYTKPDWLSNFYISASLPVGLEANLTNTNKTYLGIGGTLQPTYILGERAYLISADFKNYATMPSLTRKWNVSTSFEVFAGYTTGKIKWKVGPQVRYQLLSSFEKKYPVKEHIMDFGLKVGIMLR